MDNPTVCESQKLNDRLIQATLDSQGATCKGSSMHESMTMHHDACWGPLEFPAKKELKGPALHCEELVVYQNKNNDSCPGWKCLHVSKELAVLNVTKPTLLSPGFKDWQRRSEIVQVVKTYERCWVGSSCNRIDVREKKMDFNFDDEDSETFYSLYAWLSHHPSVSIWWMERQMDFLG